MSRLPDYIYFEETPHNQLDRLVQELAPDQVAILVDEHTKQHCLPIVANDTYNIIEIQSGEIHKTLETCALVWQKMTELGMSRDSLLVNLGGGVIGDMGGFIAATYKRGIRFINVPTTLLSQVDASIGGKIGIDFQGLKNHIGLFRDPEAVILSSVFLKSLDRRQLFSGFAEVIKHGLIWDRDYFDQIKSTKFPEEVDWVSLLKRSVEIKSEVVLADPFEKGLRKILNFGHTFGHAVETYHLDKGIGMFHGEAIIIGMIMEMHLSYQKEWLVDSDLEKVSKWLIELYGLVNTVPSSEELVQLMRHDKKNTADQINFSIINQVGACTYDVHFDELQIESAVEFYRNLNE
ncbi:MAG: 3-dehydroquinate synthase [Cyclobacteriaceae bacterium]|jgi:3-dehydroquinate synthase